MSRMRDVAARCPRYGKFIARQRCIESATLP